jgi:hypothetical protein
MTKSLGKNVKRGTRIAWVAANQGCHFCQCGCGQPIELRPIHFHEGVPKFRLGHNPQPKKARPARKPCECGCGELAGSGKRYVSGHNMVGTTRSAETKKKISDAHRGPLNHNYGKKGPLSPFWTGGRYVALGYVLRREPDHPFASVTHRVMEHRLVVEDHLRRTDPTSPYLVDVGGVLYLRPGIEVHHINGVKDDNRVENLEPMTKAEHSRHHSNFNL